MKYLMSYNDGQRKRPRQTFVPTIVDVYNGFWINKHGKFVRDSTAVTWFPASAIVKIEKVDDEQESDY